MTTWNELRLEAAEAPRPDAGVVIGRPLVRTRAGDLHIIRRVDESPPRLGSPITPDELTRLAENGAWLSVADRGWMAQRGCLTVVKSVPFTRVIDALRAESSWFPDLEWHDGGTLELAYAPREQVQRWRCMLADVLLRRVERLLCEGRSLGALRDELLQNFFLTDERGDRRRRTYLNLAVLDRMAIGQISPGVLRLLRREFELSTAEAEAETSRHHAQIMHVHGFQLPIAAPQVALLCA